MTGNSASSAEANISNANTVRQTIVETIEAPRLVDIDTAVKSDWVYEVQDLIQDKCELVHARRLLLYRAEMDGKEVTPKLLQAAAHSGTRYETAHALKSIRQKRDLIEVQVEWEGLPDDIDFTWEPLAQVFEDLPGLLEDFLHTAGERTLKRRALEQCSLS